MVERCRLGDRSGGAGRDRRVHRVRDALSGQQVDVVDGDRPAGGDGDDARGRTRRPDRRRALVGHAGERRRQDVPESGVRDRSRPVVAEHDRVGQGLARTHVDLAVGLGHGEVGQHDRVGIGRRVVPRCRVGEPGGLGHAGGLHDRARRQGRVDGAGEAVGDRTAGRDRGGHIEVPGGSRVGTARPAGGPVARPRCGAGEDRRRRGVGDGGADHRAGPGVRDGDVVGQRLTAGDVGDPVALGDAQVADEDGVGVRRRVVARGTRRLDGSSGVVELYVLDDRTAGERADGTGDAVGHLAGRGKAGNDRGERCAAGNRTGCR